MSKVNLAYCDPETHIVVCDACDGYGATGHRVTVYEHGCGFPHDDTEERPCTKCDGSGQIEVEVEPITIHDLDEAHA